MKYEAKKRTLYKPGSLAFAVLFAMPIILGMGCTLGADPEEPPVPADGPVQFEILRQFMPATQDIRSCWFNDSTTRDTTHYESPRRPDEALTRLELIIDSQADFNKYLYCDDTVSINFEEEFILAGISRYQPNQIYIHEQKVEMVDGSVYFRVGISNSIWTSPSRAEYIIKVTSRDYLKYPVVFDVHWEEEI